MLNSAEDEIFSANNYVVGIFIFISREIFILSLVYQKNNLQMIVMWDLLTGLISCLVELSMKTVL